MGKIISKNDTVLKSKTSEFGSVISMLENVIFP